MIWSSLRSSTGCCAPSVEPRVSGAIRWIPSRRGHFRAVTVGMSRSEHGRARRPWDASSATVAARLPLYRGAGEDWPKNRLAGGSPTARTGYADARMSLGIAFKGPEGLVLAVDSRVTLNAALPSGPVAAYFDNATKLLPLEGQRYVGIITYGLGALGQTQPRTAHSFTPEFEAELGKKHNGRATVAQIAQAVSDFYAAQWESADMPAADTPGLMPMTFLVAGFDEGAPYGKVYEVSVPTAPTPVEKAAGEFGVTFGGQAELAARLIGGVDPRAAGLAKDVLDIADDQMKDLEQRWTVELSLPIPYQFLPLQDCVDLATFLVYMTSTTQSWTVGLRGVGGAVDVATITRTDGFQAVQQKKIKAWSNE